MEGKSKTHNWETCPTYETIAVSKDCGMVGADIRSVFSC